MGGSNKRKSKQMRDEGKITQRLFDKASINLILYLPKIMYKTLKCTYTDRHRHTRTHIHVHVHARARAHTHTQAHNVKEVKPHSMTMLSKES